MSILFDLCSNFYFIYVFRSFNLFISLNRVTGHSNPIPTIHFSNWESGTAWRCILELIKDWFASLCSIKGIRESPTEKYWKVKIRLRCSYSHSTVRNSWRYLTETTYSSWIPRFSPNEFLDSTIEYSSQLGDKYPNGWFIESLQLMLDAKEKEELFGKWAFMIW